MRTIRLNQTSQLNGVVIAPIWRRLCAWMLDAMLIIGMQVLLVLLFTVVYALINWAATGELRTNYSTKDFGSPVLAYLWIFGPYLLYHTLLLHFWNGHTPGKNFMMVQVLNKSGSRPELWRAFVRTLLMPVSVLAALLGYILFLRSRENTSFHDWVAGTLVLQEEVEHRIIRGAIPSELVSPHH